MRLFFFIVCTFLSVSCHRNFGLGKYSDFTATKFKSFADNIVVKESNAPFFMPTFQNSKAQDFFVNGTTIPDVDFDVGPSWAGLLPISNNTSESRQLYFWYFPPQSDEGMNDLVIWLNGGPGCSSLEGLLQENGPFLWQWGTAQPVPNPYAWNTLANVLWVEQPVGTGFSQGTTNIYNEDELAEQFYGFLVQFFDVFAELKNSSVYLTGESYAGRYIPYIANYIFGLNSTAPLQINLQSILLFDPYITTDLIHYQIPAVPFVHSNQNIFNLNASFLSYLDQQNEICGYQNYSQLYATYPPKGPLPTLSSITNTNECDLWDAIFYASLIINPAFNVYRITDTPPILWDVLGFPGSFPNQQSPIYFNRSDVQSAIHAPNTIWVECTNNAVFIDGVDQSLPPVYSILPNVIEKTKHTIIVNGQHDFEIMAEGVRIAIQNMSWNGLQGFQVEPSARFIVPNQGDLGFVHTERGLTYVEVALSGHMVPQFQPRASLEILKYLLGRISYLANETNSTTTTASTSPQSSSTHLFTMCLSSTHFFVFMMIFLCFNYHMESFFV